MNIKKILFFILHITFIVTVSGQNGSDSLHFFQFFFPSGKLSSEGFMKNDQPDGYWKTYYENGNVKSEGNRENFMLNGSWKFYDETGKIVLDINYEQNLKNGTRTTYMENEKIVENFEKDIKQGFTYIYYPNGSLKRDIFFRDGLEEGYAREYDEDGLVIALYQYRKGFLINREIINRLNSAGNKQGVWMYFHENGNIRRTEEWRNGLLNGFVKEFDMNGNLKNIAKYIQGEMQVDAEELKNYELRYDYYEDGRIKIMGSYRNDLPDGIRREYDPSGKIERGYIFRNGTMIAEGIVDEKGLRQGKFTEYFENGRIMAEGRYVDSRPVGFWKYYYQDGNLEQEGEFDNRGLHIGQWTWYYPNGNTWKIENYENGLLEGEYVEYDILGKIIAKGNYFDGEETGKWFWEIGDVREDGYFVEGMYSGEWKTTDLETGKLLFQGKFLDGYPNGKHTFYWQGGQRRQEGFYVMGQREGEWYYFDQEGNVVVRITYRNGIEQKYNNIQLQPQILE
jgi:uncharacterized protein